jgi:hypothetical protein
MACLGVIARVTVIVEAERIAEQIQVAPIGSDRIAWATCAS